MTVAPLPTAGNSSKFQVATKRGTFVIALSFTLRTKIWNLVDAAAEQCAATEIAEAIVSRHDPALPFKSLYIFAEHNSETSLQECVKRIRKIGIR